jgi:hypothetical protein
MRDMDTQNTSTFRSQDLEFQELMSKILASPPLCNLDENARLAFGEKLSLCFVLGFEFGASFQRKHGEGEKAASVRAIAEMVNEWQKKGRHVQQDVEIDVLDLRTGSLETMTGEDAQCMAEVIDLLDEMNSKKNKGH